MRDFVIFIRSAGPNTRIDNLYETLSSIIHNTQGCDYGFYFSVDERMKSIVETYFLARGREDLLEEIVCSNKSWATEYNLYFDKYKDKVKWFLYSHDDLTVDTYDWFSIIQADLKDKTEKVGWISILNTNYYYNLDEPRGVSFRTGFNKDREKFPCVSECHNFIFHPHYKNTKNNLHLLDFPEPKLVKVHAPMTCFNLISNDAMKKVGYCGDWTNYTILCDEDLGLEALRNNLNNVIHYGIRYTHPLRRDERPTDNKWEKEAHQGFVKKWGFDIPYTNETVKLVREKYKDTLIPWSSYRNSYDWEYLK